MVAQLLGGGATVIATTSRLDDERLAFYRRCTPRPRALRRRCKVVRPTWRPYADIDDLVAWVGNEQSESLGPKSIHVKGCDDP